MAAFSGFRPFLTKGSALNGVKNTFFANSINGAHYLPDANDVYGANGLAAVAENITTIHDEKNGIPVIGPELVVNGDFTNGISGWTIDAGLIEAISGELAITSENNVGRANQIVPVVVGKRYIVKATVRYGTSTGRFRVGTTLNGLQYNAYTGSFVSIFTAITNEMHLTPQNGGSTGISYHSNISVREISENPAIQTSASLRPLFGRAPASRRNMFTFSESFDNAAWTKSGVTVTKNAAGSSGASNTAWTVASTSTSGQIRRTISGSSLSTTYTYSIVAKAGTANWLLLQGVLWTTPGNGGAWFNLTDGAIGTVNTGFTATREAVGNGFYRCSITFTTGSSDSVGDAWAYIVSSNGNTTTSVGQTLIVEQAQFEAGSVATPYQRVDAATDMTETNITAFPFIRLDLSDDVLTTSNLANTKNLLLYTEEFDNNYWKAYSAVAVTPNSIIAPDGTLSADTIAAIFAASNNGAFQNTVAIPNGSSVSFYAKRGTVGWVAVGTAFTTFTAWFNLDTGTTGSSSNCTVSMIDAGNGWWRCCLSNITVGASRMVIAPKQAGGTGDAWSVGVNAIGDSIYLWGAQLELNPTVTDYEYGGFRGTVIVAGRNGTAINTSSLPDGVFNLGPTTHTGGTPGILRAVGDVVGYTLTGRTTTSVEQDQLINLFKSRGAKGRLITGPELITNGTFDTDITGWTGRFVFDTVSWESGTLKCTLNSGNFGGAKPSSQIVLTVGKSYTINFDVVEMFGGPSTVRYSLGGFSKILLPLGTYTETFVATSSAGLELWSNSTLGGTIRFDNISVKELRPKEEW